MGDLFRITYSNAVAWMCQCHPHSSYSLLYLRDSRDTWEQISYGSPSCTRLLLLRVLQPLGVCCTCEIFVLLCPRISSFPSPSFTLLSPTLWCTPLIYTPTPPTSFSPCFSCASLCLLSLSICFSVRLPLPPMSVLSCGCSRGNEWGSQSAR